MDNSDITVSGRDTNYNKCEDQGDGDVTKHSLTKHTGVVVGDKHRKTSSDEDEEGEEEEEYGIHDRVDKGGDIDRDWRKHQKDSREEDDE